MKIISSYPILNNNEVINPENSFTVVDSSEDVDYANYCNADADSDYSNARGKKKKPAPNERGAVKPKAKPTAAQKAAPGKKILKGLDKAKQSGLTDSLKNLGRDLLDKNKGNSVKETNAPASDLSATPEDFGTGTGMSKNTKIGLGIAAVVVVGIVGYLIFKK